MLLQNTHHNSNLQYDFNNEKGENENFVNDDFSFDHFFFFILEIHLSIKKQGFTCEVFFIEPHPL